MKRVLYTGGKVAFLVFLFSLLLMPVGAQTNFTVLKILTANDNASLPYNSLIWGTNGALYGTTVAGGVSNYGTVFRIYPDGSGFTVLKKFLGSDGLGPESGLALGTNGLLYGTTFFGGISNAGTVFRLDQNGSNYVVLHNFLGGTDGSNAATSLLVASDGNLYGTTVFANSATRGTLFKINHNGSNYTILHTFTGAPDAQQIGGKLMESTNGLLYGTGAFGGANNSGAVFHIDKNGGNYAVIFSFSSSDSLGIPEAGVIEGSDGLLYGTLYNGGISAQGSVFALAKDASSYTVLHIFTDSGGDGKWPTGELVEGADGALYGTTEQGGSASQYGTIYKLDKSGNNYTVLRDMDSTVNLPKGGVLKGSNGVFYGVTERSSIGFIYALSTNPLPSRVVSMSLLGSSNTVQFGGTSSISYDVQRSTNLTAWSPMGTFAAPSNGKIVYTDTNPPSRGAFYRLKQD